MAPLAAAAPGLGQADVDLTVGFDDLLVLMIVFTGVCLAVLLAFAVGALWVTRHDLAHEQPERKQPGERPAGGTVPLPRSAVGRLARPAPAPRPARGQYTVPLPRFVVEALKAHTKQRPAEQEAAGRQVSTRP